jgi:uncharacterized protein (DUF1501 family)
MFVVGGELKASHVYGQCLGLEDHQLNEGCDLAPATDFRTALGEILTKHFGVRDLNGVVPSFDNNSHKFPGLVRA